MLRTARGAQESTVDIVDISLQGHPREPQALGGGLRLCSGVDWMQPPAVWDQWRPVRSSWCHRRRLYVRARWLDCWSFYYVKDEYITNDDTEVVVVVV